MTLALAGLGLILSALPHESKAITNFGYIQLCDGDGNGRALGYISESNRNGNCGQAGASKSGLSWALGNNGASDGSGTPDGTADIYGYKNGSLLLHSNKLTVDSSATFNYDASFTGHKIIDLGKGTDDTDAVNVSQLRGATNAFGGGSAIRSDGSIKAPAYDIQGKTYDNVGDALSALNTGMGDISSNIVTAVSNLTNNINNGKIGLVQQAGANADITVAKDRAGEKVDFSGTGGADEGGSTLRKNRVLTGVADGRADDDAASMSQLKKTGIFTADGDALNAVIYDNSLRNRISFRGLEGTLLDNVAAGLISEKSMQAVNGGQLFAMRSQFQNQIDGLDARLDRIEGDENHNINVGGSNNFNGSTAAGDGVSGNSDAGGAYIGDVGNNEPPGSGAGDNGIVGGHGAGAYNVALGNDNHTGSNGSSYNTGIGNHNMASGGLSLAEGNHNKVTGNQSSAFGNNNQVSGDRSQGGGNENTVAGNNSIGQGNGNTVSGGNALCIGNGNLASGGNSQCLGNGNQITGDNNIGQGNGNRVAGNNGSAIGNSNTVIGDNGIAVGNGNSLSGNNATGIGFDNKVTGENGVGVGYGTRVGGRNGVGIGTGAEADGSNSVAIGPGARAPASEAAAIGSNSLADRDNTVSVGAPGHERQITHVAAGRRPTDAVNVGQLDAAVTGLNRRVDDVWQRARQWSRQAYQGIAASAALVNNMPYVPGRVALSAGVATYRGESALGVAASRWSNDGRVNVNAGVSFSGGGSPIFRAGVGIVL